MKKTFIPLTALALLALVSCGGGKTPDSSATTPSTTDTSATTSATTPSQDVVNSISITNKADLTAEWALGSADRTVNLEIDPVGNINALVQSGKITITSSAPTVVSVVGRVLHAAGVGTATITVAYGDKTDSVDVAIIGEKSAIDLYGTVHAGTLADPLDNADALLVAEKTGTTATEKYFYVKGIVESFRDAPSSYGNVSYYLKKGAGDKKSFLVYRVKLEGGKKVTDNDIWVGAEAIAKVKIVNYNNNTPETEAGGEIVSVTGEKPEIKTHVVTVAEALAAAKALADNTTSVDKYTITGYIVSVDAKGLYLSDTKGAVAASKDNFLVYDGGTHEDGCTLNAKIKLTATIKKYVSSSDPTNYNFQTATIDSLEVLEAGDAPVVAEEIDVAAALTAVNALADGATSTKKYIITGYVTEVTFAWNATNKNMSFKLGATATSTDALTVFKTGLADGTNSTSVVVGAKVKVECYLMKFVREGAVTPECVSGTTTFLEAPQTEPGVTKNATVSEALAAAKALANGGVSVDTYVITGYITKISGAYNAKFGNMSVYLSDEIDDPTATFIAFQVKCTEEESKAFVTGAKVKVTGKVTNYSGTPETVGKGAATIELVEAPAHEAVTASATTKQLKAGETTQVTAKGAEGVTFTYSTLDDKVATVDATGLVTAVGVGKTFIVATASTGRKASVEITVLANNIVEVNGFTAVKGNIGDSGYTYAAEKGAASTAPVVNGEAIRVYQKGGTFTVAGNETAKAMTSLTITSDGKEEGEGPFTYVYGASASTVGTVQTGPNWSNHQVTINFEGDNVKFFKLTTTGTTSKTRVYVKAISLALAA